MGKKMLRIALVVCLYSFFVSSAQSVERYTIEYLEGKVDVGATVTVGETTVKGYGDKPWHMDTINFEKSVEWREGIHRRTARPLTHVDMGTPWRVGNHAPSFSLSGAIIEVKEDSGPYKLGAQFAVNIVDGNMNTQTISFECTNDNTELFVKQPDIVACPINFCVGTVEVPPGSGTLIFTPRTDRFGTATIDCKAVDSGIEFPVCDNAAPPCTPKPCDTPGSNCNESPHLQFIIKITKVNDQPEFIHTGDVVSVEDVEQCIDNWAQQVTSGGWEEDYKAKDSQELYWTVKNDNPGLFKTQPYIKYTQGSRTGDLCFTPADDRSGIATAQIYLTDSGGRLDGGVDDKPPETITITILEVNDPPTFTPGNLNVVVEEDSGHHDLPWATDLSPGPLSEVNQNQQLGEFVLDFLNPAHKALFKILPVISVNTGHLSFEVADNANTFGIDCAITVHLVDTAVPPATPANSPKPWPVLHIEITPVNDPPSFLPPQPQKDLTVLEGESVSGMQWAHDICVGGKVPNCVVSEGFAGGEAQEVYFVLKVTNPELFKVSPKISPSGVLSFTTADDRHGTSTVTVEQYDTGPAPNTGTVISFAIAILPVNDQPVFSTSQTLIEVDEDAGDVVIERFLVDVAPGPLDEWDQLLSFQGTVSDPSLFKTLPDVSFVSERAGPTYGTLTFTPAADRFGVVELNFALKDDGGLKYVIKDQLKVQKDATGEIGVGLTDLDVTRVDPDGTGYSAGFRVGMKLIQVSGVHANSKQHADELIAAAPATGEFTVTIQNGTDITYGPTVKIHIKQVNDPPSFLKGTDVAVPEDNPEALNVFRSWVHEPTAGPFEDTLQYVAYKCVHDPPEGLTSDAVINENGDLSFKLTPDFYGTILVEVRIADYDRGTKAVLTDWGAPQTFNIVVRPVNDAPLFEINHGQLEVQWCSPDATDLCQRDYPNWAWGVSVGPANEADQKYEFLIEGGADLFEPHHMPTVSTDNMLHFTLKKGQLPTTPVVPFKVIMHDDGGTEDGGIDKNTATFSMRFVVNTTLAPSVPSGLIILERTATTPGQTYVVPPLMRVISVEGPIALPVGSVVKANLYSVSVSPERVIESNLFKGDGLETFRANGTSIPNSGQYQFRYEVHLPDGHIFSASDDPFTIKPAGTIDSSVLRASGAVIADRNINEWDLRGEAVTLVLTTKGNTWLQAAVTASVELRRRSAGVLQGTNTGSTGQATNLTSSTGEQLSTLQSTATIDSPSMLSIKIARQPVLNLISESQLVVNLPVGSVSGVLAPDPIVFPLDSAPSLQISVVSVSELDIRTTGAIVDFQITGTTWSPSVEYEYLMDALSSSTAQPDGFNTHKNRLLRVTSVSPWILRATLGPLVDYDITLQEVVSVDTDKLRVVSNIRPDFDLNPSSFFVAVHDTAVVATPPPADEYDGYYTAGFVLSVVVAVTVLVTCLGHSPMMLASPLAVPFVLQPSSSRPMQRLFDGISWWIRPKVLKLGGGPDDLQYSQGAMVLLTAVMVGLLVVHALGVLLHYMTKKPRASIVESDAALRFPGMWLLAFYPMQQCALFNCMYTMFSGDSSGTWKAIGILVGVVVLVIGFAVVVFVAQRYASFAWSEGTEELEMSNVQRVVLYESVWKSYKEGNVGGVRRKGTMLASYRETRVWWGGVTLVWLLSLNTLSAISTHTSGKFNIWTLLVTILYFLGLVVTFPGRSTVLQWFHALIIVLLCFVAADFGEPSAILAVITLICFVLLFFLTVLVAYLTHRLSSAQPPARSKHTHYALASQNPISHLFPGQERPPTLSEQPLESDSYKEQPAVVSVSSSATSHATSLESPSEKLKEEPRVEKVI